VGLYLLTVSYGALLVIVALNAWSVLLGIDRWNSRKKPPRKAWSKPIDKFARGPLRTCDPKPSMSAHGGKAEKICSQ
jgi:hypothetical protein